MVFWSCCWHALVPCDQVVPILMKLCGSMIALTSIVVHIQNNYQIQPWSLECTGSFSHHMHVCLCVLSYECWWNWSPAGAIMYRTYILPLVSRKIIRMMHGTVVHIVIRAKFDLIPYLASTCICTFNLRILNLERVTLLQYYSTSSAISLDFFISVKSETVWLFLVVVTDCINVFLYVSSQAT
jgi:hypothetical protein